MALLAGLSDPKSTILKESDEIIIEPAHCCVRPCAAKPTTATNEDPSSCCLLKCSDVLEWPSLEDVTLVPAVGTYHHNGRSQQATDDPAAAVQQGEPRVLLYITSHFSTQHELYLRYCWKNLLARSPLLQAADVAVLLNPNDANVRRPAMDLLREVFADHDLTVYLRSYENMHGTEGAPSTAVKRTGAIMAIYEAVTEKYFEGYDWVIRVNPDVLIRDDTFFRHTMSDPGLSALLINCVGMSRKKYLHSDFFAVRPEVLVEEEYPEVNWGAEQSFTDWIRHTVLDKSPVNFAWVPNAYPMKHSGCRAGAGKDYYDSPVIHEHAFHPDICSVPEEDVPYVTSAGLLGRWPANWKPPV